eukprot:scaffold135893_cov23-Prasinocladus_malaysianus.AAC.1
MVALIEAGAFKRNGNNNFPMLNTCSRAGKASGAESLELTSGLEYVDYNDSIHATVVVHDFQQ